MRKLECLLGSRFFNAHWCEENTHACTFVLHTSTLFFEVGDTFSLFDVMRKKVINVIRVMFFFCAQLYLCLTHIHTNVFVNKKKIFFHVEI